MEMRTVVAHRSLADRWREDPWIQTGEAVGHVVVGASSVAILAGFGTLNFLGWQIVGGALAMVPWIILRELIDQWPIESWGDTALDSLEFIIGGALGGVVLWCVIG